MDIKQTLITKLKRRIENAFLKGSLKLEKVLLKLSLIISPFAVIFSIVGNFNTYNFLLPIGFVLGAANIGIFIYLWDIPRLAKIPDDKFQGNLEFLGVDITKKEIARVTPCIIIFFTILGLNLAFEGIIQILLNLSVLGYVTLLYQGLFLLILVFLILYWLFNNDILSNLDRQYVYNYRKKFETFFLFGILLALGGDILLAGSLILVLIIIITKKITRKKRISLSDMKEKKEELEKRVWKNFSEAIITKPGLFQFGVLFSMAFILALNIRLINFKNLNQDILMFIILISMFHTIIILYQKKFYKYSNLISTLIFIVLLIIMWVEPSSHPFALFLSNFTRSIIPSRIVSIGITFMYIGILFFSVHKSKYAYSIMDSYDKFIDNEFTEPFSVMVFYLLIILFLGLNLTHVPPELMISIYLSFSIIFMLIGFVLYYLKVRIATLQEGAMWMGYINKKYNSKERVERLKEFLTEYRYVNNNKCRKHDIRNVTIVLLTLSLFLIVDFGMYYTLEPRTLIASDEETIDLDSIYDPPNIFEFYMEIKSWCEINITVLSNDQIEYGLYKSKPVQSFNFMFYPIYNIEEPIIINGSGNYSHHLYSGLREGSYLFKGRIINDFENDDKVRLNVSIWRNPRKIYPVSVGFWGILPCLLFVIPPSSIYAIFRKDKKLLKNKDLIINYKFFSDEYLEKLSNVGITRLLDYYNFTKTREGRKNLQEMTGIDYNEILIWANYSDLMRIRGIIEEYAVLLEAIGVDTVIELSHRNPINLNNMIKEYDISQLPIEVDKPTLEQLINWIEQAQHLPRGLEY